MVSDIQECGAGRPARRCAVASPGRGHVVRDSLSESQPGFGQRPSDAFGGPPIGPRATRLPQPKKPSRSQSGTTALSEGAEVLLSACETILDQRPLVHVPRILRISRFHNAASTAFFHVFPPFVRSSSSSSSPSKCLTNAGKDGFHSVPNFTLQPSSSTFSHVSAPNLSRPLPGTRCETPLVRGIYRFTLLITFHRFMQTTQRHSRSSGPICPSALSEGGSHCWT